MKYTDFQKCMKIAEEHCRLSGMRISDADVSIVNFQDGANGKVKQRMCFVLDYDDAKISIEITPKGAGDNGREPN